MNIKKYIIIYFVLMLSISQLFASSRVAFSRPNSVFKTPTSYLPDLGEGKVALGFSSEMIDFEVPSNSSSALLILKSKNGILV